MSPALFAILRAPAVRALLIQCASLPLAFAAILLLAWLQVEVTAVAAALVQGAMASLISRWRRLAPWWLPIQLLFPVLLLQGLAWQAPPWLFLAAFVVLLLVYWSTFRTQVPYYPSGRQVWDAVADLLPAGRPLHLIDIGSGLGGLVLDLAARRPESTFVGIELAPLPWLVSKVRASARARLGQANARFILGDYEQLDFAAFDAVFAYLSPAVMGALWRKAAAEMRPGSMLLSYEFVIADKTPDLTILPTGRGPALYVWHF